MAKKGGRFSKLELGENSKKIPRPHSAVEEYSDQYYLGLGLESYMNGRYEESIRIFSKAININRDFEPAWLGQIVSMLKHGDLKEANIWIERAVERFKYSSDVWSLKSLLALYMGEKKKALSLSDIALTKDKPTYHSWLVRAQVLLTLRTNGWDFCIDRALEVNPNDFIVLFEVGDIMEQYNKLSQAEDYFNQSVALKPKNAYVWYRLGLVRSKMGFGKRSLDCFEEALNLEGDRKEFRKAFKKAKKSGVLSRLFRKATSKSVA